jgi:serine/threonine-protein kinase RsbW
LSTRIAIKINARLEELSKVEAIIEQLYEEGKISDESYGNVIVAATEATLNAIHHGSKDDPNKVVDVVFIVDRDKMVMEVSDSGPGFDPDKLPDPTDPANIEKGSGRGIYIMRNLSDEMEFLNDGATVKVTFERKSQVAQGA